MLISLLLLCNLAQAEDFKQLEQGQPAPFSGTLMRPEAMATMFTQEDAKLERCKIDSEHILKEEKIKCELEVQKVTYDFTIYKETNEALMIEKDKELDKLYEILKKNPANHTPLWIGIGFVAGIGTSIGMIYTYEQMQ